MGRSSAPKWLKPAREANLPTFLDTAADVSTEVSPVEYANMGFDLITFSGGKAIRGPQTDRLANRAPGDGSQCAAEYEPQ